MWEHYFILWSENWYGDGLLQKLALSYYAQCALNRRITFKTTLCWCGNPA